MQRPTVRQVESVSLEHQLSMECHHQIHPFRAEGTPQRRKQKDWKSQKNGEPQEKKGPLNQLSKDLTNSETEEANTGHTRICTRSCEYTKPISLVFLWDSWECKQVGLWFWVCSWDLFISVDSSCPTLMWQFLLYIILFYFVMFIL